MHTEVIKLYDNREDVTLTTYVLADSDEMLNGQKRPAIIICPGGAYLNCSDREAEPVALRFAAMGYHTFVLRYSTYGEGKTITLDSIQEMKAKKHCQHPMPMREIGKAMLIVREHGDEWLVDTEKIAICGFSAGAHNCAMYSTYWHTDILSGYFNVEPEMLKPAATILGYTLSDYIYMKYHKKDDVGERVFSAANLAFLGTTNPDDSVMEKVSPARHVSEHTPPMFLWATAEDSLVPAQHTILMAHALADKNIPFEVHIFEKGEHGLSLSTQASAGTMSHIDTDAAKWVSLAEAWLEKRFKFWGQE